MMFGLGVLFTATVTFVLALCGKDSVDGTAGVAFGSIALGLIGLTTIVVSLLHDHPLF